MGRDRRVVYLQFLTCRCQPRPRCVAFFDCSKSQENFPRIRLFAFRGWAMKWPKTFQSNGSEVRLSSPLSPNGLGMATRWSNSWSEYPAPNTQPFQRALMWIYKYKSSYRDNKGTSTSEEWRLTNLFWYTYTSHKSIWNVSCNQNLLTLLFNLVLSLTLQESQEPRPWNGNVRMTWTIHMARNWRDQLTNHSVVAEDATDIPLCG